MEKRAFAQRRPVTTDTFLLAMRYLYNLALRAVLSAVVPPALPLHRRSSRKQPPGGSTPDKPSRSRSSEPLRGIHIVGADIVCFCPPLDNPGQITALTASEILLQFVSHVADYRTRSLSGTGRKS